MLTIPTFAAALLATGLCYLVAIKIWSVFFGSLSKIPGPKWAAATRWVLRMQEYYGNCDNWKLQLHRTYGDVVRIAPSEISFANDSAWKEIYGYAPGSQYAILPKDVPFFAPNLEPAPNLIIADDLNHARQRKCFNPAFGDRALRAQEPLIQRYVSKLLRNIGDTTTNPEKQKFDIERQYNFITFDIMADLMFGEPLGCLETSTYHPWIQFVWDFLHLAGAITEVERIPWLKKLLTIIGSKSLKTQKEQHFKFSADCVDKRLAQKTSRNDVWQFVLAAEGKNLKLTKDEMHSNAQLFMLAGSETSATALSALTYYLLTNPEAMKLLTQQIRSRFNSPEQINVVDTLTLTYLTACIQEAFRMHPPVPIGIPRGTPRGGAEVGGYKLPENILVSVHQLSVYHNPRNFIHHDKFLPQRWLAADDTVGGKLKVDAAEFQQDKKHSLQPFSVGPRNCIGQPLAWMEIRLIITQVLWHFDLELCDESKDWDDSPVYRLWRHKPLIVTAKPVARHDLSSETKI